MDEFAEINITPFTDVLLVLLIIFMVLAALIVPAGFEKQFNPGGGLISNVNVPHANLAIARSGAMYLNGQSVNEKSVYPALAALHASHTNIALSIYGDSKAPYRYVMRVMDAAKMASINNVNFVSQ